MIRVFSILWPGVLQLVLRGFAATTPSEQPPSSVTEWEINRMLFSCTPGWVWEWPLCRSWRSAPQQHCSHTSSPGRRWPARWWRPRGGTGTGPWCRRCSHCSASLAHTRVWVCGGGGLIEQYSRVKSEGWGQREGKDKRRRAKWFYLFNNNNTKTGFEQEACWIGYRQPKIIYSSLFLNYSINNVSNCYVFLRVMIL